MTVLSPELIALHLTGTTKDEIIDELIDVAMKSGKVRDRALAKASVLERESRMSTGMKHGIAIPHGKTGAVSELVAASASPIPKWISTRSTIKAARSTS